jgi:hypothetical protein
MYALLLMVIVRPTAVPSLGSCSLFVLPLSFLFGHCQALKCRPEQTLSLQADTWYAATSNLYSYRTMLCCAGSIAAVLKLVQTEAVDIIWRKLRQEHEEDTGAGGFLLAHGMGLGKTLTTIYFLLRFF